LGRYESDEETPMPQSRLTRRRILASGTVLSSGHVLLRGARMQIFEEMTNPASTAQIGGYPIHPMHIPFPLAFLVGTLVSDVMYRNTGNPFWATTSYWLLAAALIMAALAAVAGLIDFLSEPRIRAVTASWHHMVGNVTAVVLSLANFLLHYRDGIGAYPTALWISLVVMLLLLLIGWKGGELVFKHRVGVSGDNFARS